jgi:hypothetical protein
LQLHNVACFDHSTKKLSCWKAAELCSLFGVPSLA